MLREKRPDSKGFLLYSVCGENVLEKVKLREYKQGKWLPEAEGGERGLTVKMELFRMMEAFCLCGLRVEVIVAMLVG